MSKKLSIKLRRSCIGKPEKQRRVVAGLGLKKMNQVIVRMDSPEVRGMIQKISHMLEVEEIS
ncbi:MAG: 50S ribosomal protein L30 [Nitrospiria bacterium]